MSSFISNAFMLPNDLIDKGYMAHMKGPALPCYIFIVRKTRGWNKSDDSISVSQLIKGTGYNKDSILKGCEKLVSMGIIERKSFKNQPAKYVLTDSIFAVDILDSEKIAGENIEGGVDILDSTLSKDSTHNNNSKTTITKTSTHTELAVEIQDDSWKPNLDFLKTVLKTTKFSQRADEILAMTDFEFHLGNFNAHWENKITLTENQKTRKFATWIASEFESQLNKIERTTKNKPSLNVNDAWADIPQFTGEVTRVEIPEDFP